MANDSKPRSETEESILPGEPTGAEASIDSTGVVSDETSAVGESDPSGHVALLRRRLLDLLDEHDET